MSRLYLGVDGGQSSTVALVADENGRVLGSGQSGPCNHVSDIEGRAKFLSVVGACLAQATRGITGPADRWEFAAACLGFSGGAADKVAYTRELISTPLLKVTHDAEVALIGATEGAPGIVVIAGTGSIVFGRNAAGATARAGGWGYVIGDEGGGFDIARRALRAALRFEEGWGPDTVLYARLLEATGAQTANELMHSIYAGMSRGKIAAAAELVSEASEKKDAVAQQILTEAAHALAWYVEGVYRQLFTDSEAVAVAYIGGVFRSATLTRSFRDAIHARLGCDTIAPRLSPAAGALLEALRMDGNSCGISNIPGTKT